MLGPRTQPLQPQGRPRALRRRELRPAWLTRTERFAAGWWGRPSVIPPWSSPGHTANKAQPLEPGSPRGNVTTQMMRHARGQKTFRGNRAGSWGGAGGPGDTRAGGEGGTWREVGRRASPRFSGRPGAAGGRGERWQAWRGGLGGQSAHRTLWVLTLTENTVLSTLDEAPAAKDRGPTHVLARAPPLLGARTTDEALGPAGRHWEPLVAYGGLVAWTAGRGWHG